MADQNINVNITATIEGLIAGVNAVTEKIESIAAPINAVKTAFAELGEVMLTTFAVEKIVDFIEKTIEFGAQADHLSQELGISTEEVGAFTFAAGAMGVSVEAAAHAMERLERNMSAAEQGTGRAAFAFSALGISIKSSSGELKTLDDILPEIANKFAESANGPEKTAIAIALLGRAGADMIPFLNRGAEGLAEFKKIAQETGTVMSDEVAKGFEESEIKSYALEQSFKGLALVLGEKLKPAFDAVVEAMTHSNEAMTRLLRGDEVAHRIAVMNQALVSAQTELQKLTTLGAQGPLLEQARGKVDALQRQLDKLIAEAKVEADKADEPKKPKLKSPEQLAVEKVKDNTEIQAEKANQDAITKATLDGELARAAAEKAAAEERLKLGLSSQAQETAAVTKAANDKNAAEVTAAKATYDAKKNAIDEELALESTLPARRQILEGQATAAKLAYDGVVESSEKKLQTELEQIRVDGANKSAANTQKGAELVIAAANKTASAQSEIIKQNAAQGKISTGEETAQLVAEENKRYAAVQSSYAKINQLGNQSNEIQAANRAKSVEAEQAHQAKLAEIQGTGAVKGTQEQIKSYDEQIAAADRTYAAEIALLKQKVARGEITIAEETQQQLAQENVRYAATQAAYARINALGGQSAAVRQGNQAKEQADTQEHFARLAEISSEGETKAAAERIAIIKKESDDAIKIANTEYENDKKNVDLKASLHLITAGQRQSLENTLASQLLAITVARLNAELAAEAGHADAIAAIRARLADAYARYNSQIEEQNRQRIQTEQSDEREFSDAIIGDFGSALGSMLTQQETWNQRILNLANALTSSLVNIFTRRVEFYVDRLLFGDQVETGITAARTGRQVASSTAVEGAHAAEVPAHAAVETAKSAATDIGTAQRTGAEWSSSTAVEARHATEVPTHAAVETQKSIATDLGVGQRTAAEVGAGTAVEGVEVGTAGVHETIEATKTVATVVGAETRTAAEETSASAGIFAQVGSAIKSITVSAYQAAAGVYASVSSIPFVGWILAPVLAAAALAAVLHFAGAFETGSWNIPETQIAQVHKGEMIIPAQEAGQIRAAAPGKHPFSALVSAVMPPTQGTKEGQKPSSLAAYATGAWSVPATEVVQVHKGEMIVPEKEAAQIRLSKETISTNDFAAIATKVEETTKNSSLKAFATGAWTVPTTETVQIHQGEMVIPAQQAGQLRSGIKTNDFDTLVSTITQTAKSSVAAYGSGEGGGANSPSTGSAEAGGPGSSGGSSGSDSGGNESGGSESGSGGEGDGGGEGSFASGIWNVPTNQSAEVHRGEMVVPEQQAHKIREAKEVVRTNDFSSLIHKAVTDITKNTSLQSYAEGAWSVPKDQTAHVHEGEMIVPKQEALILRTSSGLGPTGDFRKFINNLVAGTGGGQKGQAPVAFDLGAWNVPASQTGTVHKGEMIIPADVAEAVRSPNAAPFASGLSGQLSAQYAAAAGGRGGSDSPAAGGTNTTTAPTVVNFNVTATDAASVTALFKRNGRVMADIVAGQIRSAPASMTKTVKNLAGPAY